MQYDQSWMGYGFVGGLEAGGIAAVLGLLIFAVVYALTRKQPWSTLRRLTIPYLLALLPSASGDTWNLFYFNFTPITSLILLRAQLATIHDPDNIGLRVLCDLIGAGLGVTAGWLLLVARHHPRADG